MELKEIVAIILIALFLIFYLFVILRVYFIVRNIVKDNEKLKKFLDLLDKEEQL